MKEKEEIPEFVYLVHRDRPGKPIEIKAENYKANPMAYGGEGWRLAEVEEVKMLYKEEDIVEAKEPTPKKKKTATKKDK